MQTHTSFGDMVRETRRALDLTQARLAAEVGCAPDTLRKIERGRYRPSQEIAKRLAECLKVAPEDQQSFVYQARAAANALDSLSSTFLPQRINKLPTPPTPLIGRAQEVTTARAILRRQDVRLLTLTGAPGIGKTRLALQLAHETASEFKDGVVFVNLGSLRDPQQVAGTIAQRLGNVVLVEDLEEYLREKQMLLLLDNFEQLREAAPLLGALISAAPRLKVLVTSREALRVYGEYEFNVPPLALPLPEEPTTSEALKLLSNVPSVALFLQRAQAVKPDFALTIINSLYVAEICVRLDGLPLSIELAAARTKLLSPENILAKLDHRLHLLTGGARDLPPRQQSLRDAINWSFHLLQPEEQVLFRRMSVFAGGCTHEAVEAVCNVGDDLQMGSLDALQSLVDKSLLYIFPGACGTSRFGMLETIREYALEELIASGELEVIQRLHAQYYQSQVELMAPELDKPRSDDWIEVLVQEHDNLQEALEAAFQRGDTEEVFNLSSVLWESGISMPMARVALGWTRAES